MAIGPYGRLVALAEKAEKLAKEVRENRGKFFGGIHRGVCGKKRSLPKVNVCNLCGLVF